jgi:hypothetical protein
LVVVVVVVEVVVGGGGALELLTVQRRVVTLGNPNAREQEERKSHCYHLPSITHNLNYFK